ncbi:unnamed protein product [Arabidopsis arenosa]|uniref:Uncharacterized protein n=1 Tax=Arabidopsis arenosa TaxID=38785 RepID=A0A8S2AKX7_ARAAE|nr:unnamed protein product [Arabidopsis arenosa]
MASSDAFSNVSGEASTQALHQPSSLSTKVSHDSRGGSRNYYTPRDNFTAPQRFHRDSASSAFSQEATNNLKRNYDRLEGRIPHLSEERSQNHRGARNIPERSQHHHRAPYKPHGTSRSSSQSDRFHTSGNLHWREKTPLPTQVHGSPELPKSRRPPLERTSLNSDPQTPPPPPLWRHGSLEATSPGVPIPSKDQVLDQIIEAAVASAPNFISPSLDPSPQNIRASPSIGSPLPTKEPEKQVKRGRGRPPLAKQNVKPPTKLSGAKSQKRNLIQGSPKKTTGSKTSCKPVSTHAGPSQTKSPPGNQSKSGSLPSSNSGSSKGNKNEHLLIAVFIYAELLSSNGVKNIISTAKKRFYLSENN